MARNSVPASLSLKSLRVKDHFPTSVPTSFHWVEGGSAVYLIGSWSQWKDYTPMVCHVAENGQAIFTVIIELPVGIHSYKFMVDNKWSYAKDQQIMTECSGFTNNCVSVTALALQPPLPSPYTPYVDLPEFAQTPDSLGSIPSSLCSGHFIFQEKVKEIVSTEVYEDKRKELKNTDDTSKLVLADRRLVIIMVGLPARGKSFVANKVARYLRWLGYKTKVFNIGSYRRDRLGCFHSHDFFRPDNPEGIAARRRMCQCALEDLHNWFLSGGNVAILDATNHTASRRHYLCEQLQNYEKTDDFSIKVMFIEILCNDNDIIQANIKRKIAMSPDYKSVDPEKAYIVVIPEKWLVDVLPVANDFLLRIKHYEDAYESITDKRLSYVKVFNVGEGTITNRITGFIPTRIVFFLMNLHILPRPIYFTRHGESEFNVQNKIGGNSPLSPNGRAYAKALAKFLENPSAYKSSRTVYPDEVERNAPLHIINTDDKELCIWTSTMLRAIQTARYVKHTQMIQWKALKEIDVGHCDGMSYDELKEKMPNEYKQRYMDKLNYRYLGTGGESYMDLIARVEPVILELERQPKPVLVIAHRAVLRCLLAYFRDLDIEDAPHIPVPLHTVIKLVPMGYKPVEEYYQLEVPTSTSQSPDILIEEP